MGVYRPENGVSVVLLSNWRVEGSSARKHVFESVSALYHQLLETSVSRGNSTPSTFSLGQNFPNPMNPSTAINYALPQRSHVTLTVFNTLGQQVATLVDGEMEAGSHEVRFEATGLASGIYFYTLRAGEFRETKRMILVR